MAIDLREYEAGRPFEGDYPLTLETLQRRLSQLLVVNQVNGRKAIILFEGWPGSGIGGAIQRLTAHCDPRLFKVWSMRRPPADEQARHYLWPCWSRLPLAGEIALFDHSWYRRLVDDWVEGRVGEEPWLRAYDEINEFESLLAADGVVMIKLFLHVTAETQEARLRARLEHPWKRRKVEPDWLRSLEAREPRLEALADMFLQTDTPWARWAIVDANDKLAARISVLRHVADRLESSLAPEPRPRPDPEQAEQSSFPGAF